MQFFLFPGSFPKAARTCVVKKATIQRLYFEASSQMPPTDAPLCLSSPIFCVGVVHCCATSGGVATAAAIVVTRLSVW